MNDISIIITSFKERRNLVKSLINNIRKYDKANIFLIINGNNEEYMDNSYRIEMLHLAAKYDNIFILTCPEFKSLAKMWNTGVIFSNTEYNLILNDDIEYNNPNIIHNIQEYIHSTNDEFFTINYSFSHFVVTKQILHQLGYFDERFLAFGEEDGDMVYRYIEMFNRPINNIIINGIENVNRVDLSTPIMETHIYNKPKVNRKIAELKYIPDKNGIVGMAPQPMKKIWEDYQQYPYENFVKYNKHNTKKFNTIIQKYE